MPDVVVHQVGLLVLQMIRPVLVDKGERLLAPKEPKPDVQQIALSYRSDDGSACAFKMHLRHLTCCQCDGFHQNGLKRGLKRPLRMAVGLKHPTNTCQPKALQQSAADGLAKQRQPRITFSNRGTFARTTTHHPGATPTDDRKRSRPHAWYDQAVRRRSARACLFDAARSVRRRQSGTVPQLHLLALFRAAAEGSAGSLLPREHVRPVLVAEQVQRHHGDGDQPRRCSRRPPRSAASRSATSRWSFAAPASSPWTSRIMARSARPWRRCSRRRIWTSSPSTSASDRPRCWIICR